GTWLITSTPAATTTSWAPDMTAWAAKCAACCDEPHWRSTVVAGMSSGQPAASTALRPMLSDCAPACMTQPMLTSSTSIGSRSLRCTRALRTSAARSAGCQPESLPLRLPPAVRTASTIAAVGMGGSFCLAPPPGAPGRGHQASRGGALDRSVKPVCPAPRACATGADGAGGAPGTVALALWRSSQAGEGGHIVETTPRTAVAEAIDAEVAGQTILGRWHDTVDAHPDLVALRDRDGDGWREITFARLADQVARTAAGMRALGVGPGDRVVLMMRNIPEFHVVDLAALCCGATPISIYNSSAPEQVAYLVGHSK